MRITSVVRSELSRDISLIIVLNFSYRHASHRGRGYDGLEKADTSRPSSSRVTRPERKLNKCYTLHVHSSMIVAASAHSLFCGALIVHNLLSPVLDTAWTPSPLTLHVLHRSLLPVA